MNYSMPTDRKVPPPLLDISRPEFFPGQSLSDQDLQDLTTWVQQRLRLEARCADWGIACGLHVTVDPDDSACVLISPGYGFNTARQLCVVQSYGKRCHGESRSRQTNDEGDPVNRVCLIRPQRSSECNGKSDETPIRVGPVSGNPSKLLVYDLHLLPNECAEKHSLGLSTDGSRNCRPSRHRASASVLGANCGSSYRQDENVTPQSHPLVGILERIPKLEFPPREGDTSKVREWLRTEAADYPSLLSVGPNLMIAGLNEAKDEKAMITRLVEILTWLCFSALEREVCAASETSTIPLARVWAQISRTAVEVLWIDESSPYRRSMQCDRLEFSLDDWRGKAFDDATAAAARCGVTLDRQTVPTDMETLKRLLLAQVNEKSLRVVFIDEGNRVLPYVSQILVKGNSSDQSPPPGEN